jgi:hypothetical protein
MRRVARRFFQRRHDHPLDIRIGDGAGRSWTWFVMKAVQALREEPSTPLPDRVPMNIQSARDLDVVPPCAHANTIRHRNANACALFGRRAHRSSVSRSSSVNVTAAA